MAEFVGFARGRDKTVAVAAHGFPALEVSQSGAQDRGSGGLAGNKQTVVHPLTLAPSGHDSSLAEIGQVARNLGLAEAQNFDKITDANFAVADEIQDAQTGRVREGAKEQVERGSVSGRSHASNHITYALTYIRPTCSLPTYSPVRI